MSREEAPKSTVLGKDWKGPLCIRSGYLLFRHCSAFYFSHRYTCLFLKAGLGFKSVTELILVIKQFLI